MEGQRTQLNKTSSAALTPLVGGLEKEERENYLLNSQNNAEVLEYLKDIETAGFRLERDDWLQNREQRLFKKVVDLKEQKAIQVETSLPNGEFPVSNV